MKQIRVVFDDNLSDEFAKGFKDLITSLLEIPKKQAEYEVTTQIVIKFTEDIPQEIIDGMSDAIASVTYLTGTEAVQFVEDQEAEDA